MSYPWFGTQQSLGPFPFLSSSLFEYVHACLCWKQFKHAISLGVVQGGAGTLHLDVLEPENVTPGLFRTKV